MKKLFWAILIMIFAGSSSFAQPRNGFERIHAAKIAYITDRLHLSARQASLFTPLYDDYEQSIRDLRRSFLKKYKGVDPMNADDSTSRQFVDDNLDYQQQVIDIKRRYNDRFLKIISSQQLSELYKADHEFQQMLMQRLKQRQNGRHRRNRW